ncbi:type II secretion system protein [Beduini massiliensis]|nr:type II secretion system protein [Beduini massiliensis]
MPAKSGFTMIESLFSLGIIMLMLFLALPNLHDVENFIDDQEQWRQKIYHTQLKAMISKTRTELETTGVTFNAFGNIHHAATITLDGHKCIFQLGSGRFYFE